MKRRCCSPSSTAADRSETWAGRGAKPRWMVAALKKGKKIDSFLIKEDETSPGSSFDQT